LYLFTTNQAAARLSVLVLQLENCHLTFKSNSRHIVCSVVSDQLDINRFAANIQRRNNMTENSTTTDFAGTQTTGQSTGTATALAHEYGAKISEAAGQAKEFVSDKISVVGDKIKELKDADFGEMAETAKDYARKNPGQAILISAAAGLLIGLIIRGRR